MLIMTKAKKPSLQRLLDLHSLINQFQEINRILVYYKDSNRAENDVEHSYSLAMMAWYIAGFFDDLDQNTVIKIALAHDLVEVHAGDTSVFAHKDVLDAKPIKEAKAANKLKQEWPDFADMHIYIDQYKNKSNKEALFVYALDKLMPLLFNITQNGLTWHQHNISIEQLKKVKKGKVDKDPIVNEYYKQACDLLEQNPQLFNPVKK